MSHVMHMASVIHLYMASIRTHAHGFTWNQNKYKLV